MDEFFTIKENVTAEITEKKSKFIANLFYIESREMAENVIKETKKKFHDARHNCIAYRVVEAGQIIEKSSDDGEPSGTAGAPMLDLLKKSNLCNVLVIVTRYFGGILLGTGGLVRAYSESTQKAIEESEIVCKCLGYEVETEIDYKEIENFKYYCKNNNIQIISMEYLETVVCKIQLEKAKKQKFIDDIDTKMVLAKNIKFLSEKYTNKSVEK